MSSHKTFWSQNIQKDVFVLSFTEDTNILVNQQKIYLDVEFLYYYDYPMNKTGKYYFFFTLIEITKYWFETRQKTLQK